MTVLTASNIKLLKKIYYEDGMIFGRDKLYAFIRDNHPDENITKRELAQWIASQEITQLHKKHEAPKDIKSTVMKRPHAQMGVDLVDMQLFETDGYKYLLNGVDLFTRKIYSIALKNKEDSTVLTGLKSIIKQVPDIASIRHDNGSEFVATIVKEYLANKHIKQVFSAAYAPQSNGAIERANQTLKRLIHKNIEVNPKFNWVKSLKKTINIINQSEIASKGKSANQIESGGHAVHAEIYQKDKEQKASTLAKPPLHVGDRVRVYDPTNKMKSRVWSKDVYEITKIFRPKTAFGIFEYQLLGDPNGKKYKQEDLQVITKVQHVIEEQSQFEVSKLLDSKLISYEPHILVKWKGYKATENTWEPRASLMLDVPKMVRKFEREKK